MHFIALAAVASRMLLLFLCDMMHAETTPLFRYAEIARRSYVIVPAGPG